MFPAELPLSTYPVGFAAVACNTSHQIYNITLQQLYTPLNAYTLPEQPLLSSTLDFAIHLSITEPYPTTLTGKHACVPCAFTVLCPRARLCLATQGLDNTGSCLCVDNSTGPDQQVFTVVGDYWLNLNTGYTAQLGAGGINVSAGVYTFDSSLNGVNIQSNKGRHTQVLHAQ